MTSTCGWRASTARSASARSRVRLAPVGFCARGVQITARAPAASARSSPSGDIPRASTATGSGGEAVQPQRADVRQKARVLDGDRVAAGEMHRQQPLDRVHRPVRDDDAERSRQLAARRSRAHAASAACSAGAPYSDGSYPRDVLDDVRQQPRIRVAAGQIDQLARAPTRRRERRPARAAITVPPRPCVSATPAATSSRYAAATVLRLTPSSCASDRIGGSASPAPHAAHADEIADARRDPRRGRPADAVAALTPTR